VVIYITYFISTVTLPDYVNQEPLSGMHINKNSWNSAG
jgi:hypothetical protein